MKLLFLYFSGTGNTDYVARYLSGKLAHLPLGIELHSLEKLPPEQVCGFDLLALGFPVYAGDSPPFLQDYVSRVSPGQGRGAFVFCTKGALAASAVRQNLQRLSDRGFVPLLGGSIAMPGSDGLALVGKDSWMARSAVQKDYDHLRDADRLAEKMAGILVGLLAGEAVESFRQPLRTSILGQLFDSLWAVSYLAFANPFRTRFRADHRCESCGLCARICPVDNVELCDGHPRFGDGCVLCMRCLHACPQEAIQIGRLTVDKFRWHGPKGRFKPLRLRPEPEASGDP